MSQNIKWQRFWRRFKVFIILVIAVFAFAVLGLFQGPEFLTSGGAAAMVNGQPVTLLSFRRAVENMERSMGSRLNSLPAAQRQMFTRSLRQRALNQLISREVAIQQAATEKIYASDQEVMDTILNIPFFQVNGVFNRQNYESYLQNTRTDAADFESDRRVEIVIDRLQTAFTRAATPTNLEAELMAEASKTSLELEYADISSRSGNVKLSAKQIADFTSANTKRIDEFYETNKNTRFKNAEQVEARHILAKGDDAKAKEKIEKAKQRLANEDFAAVAKEMSEDPGSAARGGSLGAFGRGAMVKEFEEAAFSAKPGDLVGPIKSQFGYHLIKVEKKIPEGFKPLAAVRGEIAKELAEKDSAEKLSKSVTEALKGGDSGNVNRLLKSAGAKWISTGEFNLSQGSIPKLGDIPKVLQTALQLKPGQTAKEVVNHLGSKYVVRLKSLKTPNAAPTKDDVEEQQGRLVSRRTNQLFSNWLDGVMKTSEIIPNSQILGAN